MILDKKIRNRIKLKTVAPKRSHFRWIRAVRAVVFLLWVVPIGNHGFAGSTAAMTEDAVQLENQALAAKRIYKAESWNNSYELYVEAAELRRESDDVIGYVLVLVSAARIQTALGNPEAAFALLTKELPYITEKGDSNARSILLSELARISLQLGQYDSCEEYYIEAIELARSSAQPRVLADAYFSSGEHLYEMQKVDSMIDSYANALEGFQAAGDVERFAETLVAQGYAYMLRRDFFGGLRLAENALRVSRDSADERGKVNALIAIGNANLAMGELRTAYSAYIEADELAPTGLDRSRKGQIANGLGAFYEKLGDWNKSLQYRQKALILYQAEKSIAPQLYTLISAGRLANLVEDAGSAEGFLIDAERIAVSIGDDFAMAQIWLERGNAKLSSDDLKGARIDLERSVSVFRKLGDRLYLAMGLTCIGRLEERSDNLEAAQKAFEKALENNREIVNRFAESDTLFHLARVQKSKSQYDRALALISESVEISETLRGRVYGTQLRISYYSNVSARFELYIHLLMDMHGKDPAAGYDIRALEVSERSRARSLLDTLQNTGIDFLADAAPDVVERERNIRIEISLKSDELSALLSKSSTDYETAIELMEEIGKFSIAYDQLRSELREKSPRFTSLVNPPVFDLGEFRKTILMDDTLLIEFFLGAEAGYVWIVSQTGFSSYTLPGSDVIDKKTVGLIKLLTERDLQGGEDLEDRHGRLVEADKQYWNDAQELSDILLGRAAAHLKNKRLLVVADRGLHYLPLAALPRPRSDSSQPLGEPLFISNEIAYEPSAAVPLLVGKADRRAPSKKTLLVIADPVFSRDDGRVKNATSDGGTEPSEKNPTYVSSDDTTRGEGFLRLPHTRREAEMISSYLGFDEFTLLAGADASRTNLNDLNLSDYQLLHFATHTVIDDRTPELSKIVLSRFDENGMPQNGNLLLNDIYRLQLSSDLVVLSACRSGTGSEIRGEGIIGLTRGFLQGGSKAVLSSLWKVDDEGTAEFMDHYYKALFVESFSPARALRESQVKMYGNPKWRSPYFWAAFTLNGEFRSPIVSDRSVITAGRATTAALFTLTIFFLFILGKRSRNRRVSIDK